MDIEELYFKLKEELYFKLKDTFKDISEDDLDELVNVIWEKIRRANENHN